MKKLTLFIVFITLFSFGITSCDDEVITSNETNYFVGTWSVSGGTSQWVFTSGGKISATLISTGATSSWSYTYDTINFTIDWGDGTSDTGTYFFTDNYTTLTITLAGGSPSVFTKI